TVTYEILETYLIGEQPSVVADGEKKPAVQGEPA
ncbi:sarcosine oxidase subunit delta, partial [Pseudomonas aeruginosa]